MTDILASLFRLLDGSGLCSGYYCYFYIFLAPAVVVLLVSFSRKGLVEKAKKAGGFEGLTWFQMEMAAREYYRLKGYDVSMKGGGSADGGIDLIAKKGKKRILVQVKHYKSNVGVKVVREMLGVLIDRKDFNELHIISSTSFTKPAFDLAKRHKIRLIGKKQLFS